ncbi:Ras-related protein Rap [Acrasis kona]|uniref:Ras-related protein Rap n=1 Tax=Acrasis kona TaxID=1008807 RepID=A0AAW2ZEK0_9EUKA
MSDLLRNRMSVRSSKRDSTMLSSSPSSPLVFDKELPEVLNLKLTVVGPSMSGKSCVTQQFCLGQYVQEHEETIEDVFNKKCEINIEHPAHRTVTSKRSVVCNLELIDTCGNIDTMNNMSRESISNSDGVLIVFSVGDNDSYSAVMTYYDEVQKIKPLVPTVVCANKIDDKVLISDTAIMVVAGACGKVPFIKTSAVARVGIDECFSKLVNEVLDRNYLCMMDSTTSEETVAARKSISQRLSRVFKK